METGQGLWILPECLKCKFNGMVFTFQPLCDAVVGQEVPVKITFQNPLSCVLKNVIFRIEGLGLKRAKIVSYG